MQQETGPPNGLLAARIQSGLKNCRQCGPFTLARVLDNLERRITGSGIPDAVVVARRARPVLAQLLRQFVPNGNNEVVLPKQDNDLIFELGELFAVIIYAQLDEVAHEP